MKVKVIGVERMTGTNKKTGKPYDNTVVHFLCKNPYVRGEIGDRVFLNPDEYPPDSIALGTVYDLDRDGRGFCIGFSQVK